MNLHGPGRTIYGEPYFWNKKRGFGLSVFKEFSGEYFKNDLVVIPVNGKTPLVKGWQHYCDIGPNEDEIDEWVSKYGSAGMSLILGPSTSIIGIDIDTDDERIVKAVLSTIGKQGAAFVAKKGKKGLTVFCQYLFSGRERSYENMRLGNQVILEFLYKKHTILPPSIHPDTKEPYKWLSDATLLNVCIDDLPVFSRDLASEILSNVKTVIDSNDDLKAIGTKQIKNEKGGGRNDHCKNYVTWLLREGKSLEEAAEELVKSDSIQHPGHELFLDKSETFGGVPFMPSPVLNAINFSQSILNSINTDEMANGGELVIPGTRSKKQDAYNEEKSDFEYKEAMENGFYKDVGQNKSVFVPDTVNFSRFIEETKHFYTNDVSSYIYNGTFYEEISDLGLGHIILSETKQEHFKIRHENEFKNFLRKHTYGAEKRLTPPDGLLNLKNGILNMKTRELTPHSPAYNFSYCLPHGYDENAGCPEFLEFLYAIYLGDEELMFLTQQIIAFTLWGGPNFLDKAFCFYGRGRNGKTTLMNIIQALLGRHAYSTVSMGSLNQRFEVIKMVGKLANFADETPGNIDNPDVFKAITGRGEVNVEEKHEKSFSAEIQARVFFSCNDLPVFKDKSFGLDRRLIFIPFNKKIKQSEIDGALETRIIENEMSGILNWALELLPIKRDFSLIQPKATADLFTDYKIASDSFVSFMYAEYEADPSFSKGFSGEELYELYKTFMSREKAGSYPLNLDTFRKQLSFLASAEKDLSDNTRLDLFDYLCKKKVQRGVLYYGIKLK